MTRIYHVLYYVLYNGELDQGHLHPKLEVPRPAWDAGIPAKSYSNSALKGLSQ
jgi:hypothetical protein